MNLPKYFFKPGSYNLNIEGKEFLKGILLDFQFRKLRDNIGLTLPPDCTCPKPPGWPGPIAPVKNLIDFYRNSLHDISGPPWPQPSSVFRRLINSSYPTPDDIDPWPWPFGPLVRDFIGNHIIESIKNTVPRKDSYNIYDVIKREGIAVEVYTELSNELLTLHKSLSSSLDTMK